MSYKSNLLLDRVAVHVTKRARCTAETARRYRCKEGDPEAFQRAVTGQAGIGGDDRRTHTAALVWRLFGPHSDKHPEGLACEPYLRDAIYRWILATCRTQASRRSYVACMWRWVATTGRRSLSAQTDVMPRDLGDFLYGIEGEGLAPRTVVHHRDVLRSWFAFLFDRDLIRRSPVTRDLARAFRVDQASIVKGSGQRQALSLDEARRVALWCLTDALPEAGLSVMLQITGGLRSAEVAALERRHLVQRDGSWILTVPGKGKKTRCIALEPAAVATWQRYVASRRRQGDRGPLLVARGGGHYHPRQIQRWAKDAATIVGRADIISSHDLRKTCATLLRKAGAELWQIKDHLGHSSIALTDRCYVTNKPPMTATTGIVIAKANQ